MAINHKGFNRLNKLLIILQYPPRSFGALEQRKMTMLWVDIDTYFGPNRRCATALRLRDRRRHDCAGAPPSLSIALRKLRMRVLDARGTGLGPFVDRVHGVAALADMNEEHDAAQELSALGMRMLRHRDSDMRPEAYTALDRTHAALRVLH